MALQKENGTIDLAEFLTRHIHEKTYLFIKIGERFADPLSRGAVAMKFKPDAADGLLTYDSISIESAYKQILR